MDAKNPRQPLMPPENLINTVYDSVKFLVDEYGEALERRPPWRKEIRKLALELNTLLRALKWDTVTGNRYRVDLKERTLVMTRIDSDMPKFDGNPRRN